jgi:hypothetical protein
MLNFSCSMSMNFLELRAKTRLFALCVWNDKKPIHLDPFRFLPCLSYPSVIQIRIRTIQNFTVKTIVTYPLHLIWERDMLIAVHQATWTATFGRSGITRGSVLMERAREEENNRSYYSNLWKTHGQKNIKRNVLELFTRRNAFHKLKIGSYKSRKLLKSLCQTILGNGPDLRS